MTDDLSRIRQSQRPAIPLPPPPRLADYCSQSVVFKRDAEKFDKATQEWFQEIQVALALNQR